MPRKLLIPNLCPEPAHLPASFSAGLPAEPSVKGHGVGSREASTAGGGTAVSLQLHLAQAQVPRTTHMALPLTAPCPHFPQKKLPGREHQGGPGRACLSRKPHPYPQALAPKPESDGSSGCRKQSQTQPNLPQVPAHQGPAATPGKALDRRPESGESGVRGQGADYRTSPRQAAPPLPGLHFPVWAVGTGNLSPFLSTPKEESALVHSSWVPGPLQGVPFTPSLQGEVF